MTTSTAAIENAVRGRIEADDTGRIRERIREAALVASEDLVDGAYAVTDPETYGHGVAAFGPWARMSKAQGVELIALRDQAIEAATDRAMAIIETELTKVGVAFAARHPKLRARGRLRYPPAVATDEPEATIAF